MHVKVKICGITDAAGVDAAADQGADAVGFVFADSPRRVDAETAARLTQRLPPFVTTVAVFHHPTAQELRAVLAVFQPDVIQSEPNEAVLALEGHRVVLPVFHDDANLDETVAAFRRLRPSVSTVLLEAAGRGGQGNRPSWRRAAGISALVSTVLAGGLSHGNVGEAIRTVRPRAVDVASGVETAPGIKDPALIGSFVAAVRKAESRLSPVAALRS